MNHRHHELRLLESRVRYLETERAAILVEAERRIAKIDAEIMRVELHRLALLAEHAAPLAEANAPEGATFDRGRV